MSNRGRAELINRIGELIATRFGLNFSTNRELELNRAITAAAAELGFENIDALAEAFISRQPSKEALAVLARHLTIGETYFLRERKSLDFFEYQLLPALAHMPEPRQLRIWSAGCSTGEEPYSLAMLIKTAQSRLANLQDLTVTILATDINQSSLAHAEQGSYRRWSFRAMPNWLKQRYFTQLPDGNLQLADEIRRMVRFSELNLADEQYPVGFTLANSIDLIFCRNVLMYFTAECAQKIVERFYHLLVPNGYLFINASEAMRLAGSRFVIIDQPDVVIYRKPAEHELVPSTHSATISAGAELLDNFAPIETRSINDARDQALYDALDANNVLNNALNDRENLSDEVASKPPHHEQSAEVDNAGMGEQKDSYNDVISEAREYADQGQLTAARDSCQRAIALDRFAPQGYYLLATILEELDELSGAERALTQAIYLDQDYLLAHFAMGNLAARQGRRQDARRYYQNAMTLLRALPPSESLPESGGLTAGRLIEIIRAMDKQL